MPRTNPDNINLRFCNTLLRIVQDDLTRRELADFRKHAGVLETTVCKGRNRSWLIEWPRMSYLGAMVRWEGEADNRAEAKAKALNYWLEAHAPAVRARTLTTGLMYSTEERR